ncbi:hypothetical protein LWI28_021286 [Acer negundo]|uniref:Uncharacterized protein n=1 Tax=Acer negundo TaxID=4023 RepID=A0AAD5J1P4_ACENE|nr:hypothetical protein LWI28_021286 [Acer negundo]
MASETASIVQKERLSIGAKESPRVNTLGTTPIVQKTRLPDVSKGVSKGQYPRNCTNCARRKTLRWEQKSLQRSIPIGLHQLCKKQDSLVGAKKSLRVNTPKDRTNRAKTKAPRKGAKSLRRPALVLVLRSVFQPVSMAKRKCKSPQQHVYTITVSLGDRNRLVFRLPAITSVKYQSKFSERTGQVKLHRLSYYH